MDGFALASAVTALLSNIPSWATSLLRSSKARVSRFEQLSSLSARPFQVSPRSMMGQFKAGCMQLQHARRRPETEGSLWNQPHAATLTSERPFIRTKKHTARCGSLRFRTRDLHKALSPPPPSDDSCQQLPTSRSAPVERSSRRRHGSSRQIYVGEMTRGPRLEALTSAHGARQGLPSLPSRCSPRIATIVTPPS